jgi:hypothetical protein
MREGTAKSPGTRHRSIVPCFFWAICAGLFTAMVVLSFGGAQPVLAQSGETEDSVFQISEADCETLRSATGLEFGNVIFVCDAARRSCQLVDGGRALGFCADRFPDGVQPVRSRPIETALEITSTTHGTITGFVEGGDPADLVCETFVDGSTGAKACRKVSPGSGALPTCTDGASGSYFRQTADPGACLLLQDLLAETVTGEPPPDVSFALFIDVDLAGEPGSEALLVCPGRELQCVGPITESAPLNGIAVEYQFVKQVINTPGCVKVGGTCYKY